MKGNTPDVVRLLEEDPDLGGLLSSSRRADAERELVVRVHRLGVGVWDVSRLEGAGSDHVGLLLLEGVVAREVIVADHVSAELLGPGDLLRPWQTPSNSSLLPVDVLWSVLSPSAFAVLDQLNLPALPVGDATLTTGGAIALAAVVLGTLLAAVGGGKAGERYHHKVDRVGFTD